MLSSFAFKNIRGLVSIVVITFAALILGIANFSLITFLFVSLISVVAIAIGSSLPLLVHLYVRPFLRRPEPRQWRWGVSLAVIGVLSGVFFYGNTERVIAAQVVCINGLYAAGKVGCYQYGCCQAAPYRVVSARVSLPFLEFTLALSSFVFCIFAICAASFSMAIGSGLTSHCVTRMVSYWARGIDIDIRSPESTPDLYVLALALIIIVLRGSS